tara:strand:+ start:502 stop:942 length:441 start_codon:yes stop_codon:yes gene_type:complete
MPTYNLKFSNINLNKKDKLIIANIITSAHKELTGANSYFAQVIFNKNNYASHFIGGKMVKSKELFILGNIRSGRSAKIKKKLAETIRDRIIRKTKFKKDNIWIYIIDIKPDQMIEYGEILPRSGNEKNWFRNLHPSLKKRLRKIGL